MAERYLQLKFALNSSACVLRCDAIAGRAACNSRALTCTCSRTPPDDKAIRFTFRISTCLIKRRRSRGSCDRLCDYVI